ncbi:MAG: hypothetical protein B7C55_05125 [Actinomycetales bacterium mxb001]|jgi:uncharacterized membrane protein YvlD (DUF360 family)|nr:MAG: hypothetical protein B7C55_05125 [Actinomycetales bacterium mxb001]
MPKFLLGWLLSLAANAIALVICWLLLPGFKLSFPIGFIVAIVLFGIFSAFFSWLVFKMLRDKGSSVVALTGLLSTFLALLLTSLLTEGLDIDGVTTWILATLIIWLISVLIWFIPGPWRNRRRESEAKKKD